MNLPHAVPMLIVTDQHHANPHYPMARARYDHGALQRRVPLLLFFWVLFPSLLILLWLSCLYLDLALTAIVTLAALCL